MSATTGAPEEALRRQEWMIWATEPCEWYEATEEGFRIVNGRAHYNRVLHGPHGPIKVLAGDLPQIKLAETPHWHYGDLSFAVRQGSLDKWCHDFEHVEFVYDPGIAIWRLADPALPGLQLTIEVVPLAELPGLVVRLRSSQPARVLWLLSGLKHAERSILAQGPLPGGLAPDMVRDCAVALRGHVIEGRHPQCPKVTRATASPQGAYGQAKPGDLPRLVPTGSSVDGRRIPYGIIDLTDEPAYVVLLLSAPEDREGVIQAASRAPALFDEGHKRQKAVQSQATVSSPSVLLDQAVRGICASLDGCWMPPSYMHGAVRWGVECEGWFLGWRGWYGPTCLGWHDRVASAIRFHGKHRVESGMDGYMSQGKLQDWVGFDGSYGLWVDGNMGEVYLDHLYHHYRWTGDQELLREMWPVIRDAVAWEQRVLDPDGDNLFENHINTWISDGHWYCGGAGAQGSAYMYSAYHLAAEAAALVGADPSPYLRAAEATKVAMNERLWLPREGHFAEYEEPLPPHRLHEAAELPTIYHPIDSDVTDALQAYQSLRYAETRLWFPNDVMLVNDWYPVIVTNGTIAFSEMLHTALCYYRGRDASRGWRLLRACLTPFVHSKVPGTISAYGGWDARQGTYPEFTDTCSMFARTVVEGLFGIRPERQQGLVCIEPNLPPDWPGATIRLPDLTCAIRQDSLVDDVTVELTEPARLRLSLPARRDCVESVVVNGVPATWQPACAIGIGLVVVEVPQCQRATVQVRYREGQHQLAAPAVAVPGEPLVVDSHDCRIVELRDPQGLLADPLLAETTVSARATEASGAHTFFLRLTHGNTESWAPVDVEMRQAIELLEPRWLPEEGSAGLRYSFVVRNNLDRTQCIEGTAEALGQAQPFRVVLPARAEATVPLEVADGARRSPGGTPLLVTISGERPQYLGGELRRWQVLDQQARLAFSSECVPIALANNQRLENLFSQDYYDPDLPETALRINRDGLNAWTGSWYRTTYINLDHLREQLDGEGMFLSDVGVPFRQVHDGPNGLFLSRWPGWSAQATVPVGIKGRKLYLLMSNITHNNQFEIANGRITLAYRDGVEEAVDLVNPDNFDHMLQHFSLRGYPQWVGGARDGYYGHGTASGTHADIIDIALRDAELVELRVECLSLEVIVGILAATVWQEAL